MMTNPNVQLSQEAQEALYAPFYEHYRAGTSTNPGARASGAVEALETATEDVSFDVALLELLTARGWSISASLESGDVAIFYMPDEDKEEQS